jgi:hypothetical protein
MPQTVRKFWGTFTGREQLNLNWSIIDQDSVVLITASEYNNNNKQRFIGSASITVSNIAPHGPPYDSNHGVTFIVNVDWPSPIYIVTDIIVLDAKPIDVQTWIPPTPSKLGLSMQWQQSSQWCWIAVATSISHYYKSSSSWKQCAVMTDIGHRINNFPADTTGCPSSSIVAANPVLKNAMNNPANNAALYILDDPKYGVDKRYLKSGWVGHALQTVGCYHDSRGTDTTLAQVTAEVNARRPVVAEITWLNTIISHFVVIIGVLGDSLAISDPANGPSVIRWENFPAQYYDGAQLNGWDFTKTP